jgi:hypothetical protein
MLIQLKKGMLAPLKNAPLKENLDSEILSAVFRVFYIYNVFVVPDGFL